ncbi:hypothetical protein FHR95_002280 [Halomonas fontilapidosi]|uniref:Uncharacterized protein n=1 Tax=Halomonas fontilapidosi TaxID=616675 RepID=A0A7W5DKS1_9GAMM|nr:hypothetical protein [Halomonas fontilapidosi]
MPAVHVAGLAASHRGNAAKALQRYGGLGLMPARWVLY